MEATVNHLLTNDDDCPSGVISAWFMESMNYSRLSDAVRKFNSHGVKIPVVGGAKHRLRHSNVHTPAFSTHKTTTHYLPSSTHLT